MPEVNGIQLVEHFAACCPNCISQTDKLFVISNMQFDVVNQFEWHIQ
jgi:hypothetical protein